MSRRRTVGLSVSVVAGLAVASALGAAPAEAETQKHQDKKGDVAVLSAGKNKYKTLDITKYANSYGNGTLTLRTSVVRLARRGWDVEWAVQDQESGDEVGRGFIASPGGGILYGFQNADGTTCDTALGAASTKTVTLDVPADCFGTPDVIRVANYTIAPKGQGKVAADGADQGRLKAARVKYGKPLAYTAPS